MVIAAAEHRLGQCTARKDRQWQWGRETVADEVQGGGRPCDDGGEDLASLADSGRQVI